MIFGARFARYDDRWSFDAAVEWILGLLLLFAPLAFGSIQAWSQEVVLALIAAAGLCVVLKRLTGAPPALTWSWTYPVITFFLLICAFQLVPLPAAAMRVISPGTLKLKSDLLSDLPQSAAHLGRLTLSFYTWATFQQLILATAVASVFIIVIDVYRDAERITRLLTTIAIIGLGIALFAVYQNLTDATTIYGMVKILHKNSGPFMVYSHFSQFMNLSVGAAFGLLLVKLSKLSPYHRTPSEWIEAISQPTNFMVWILLFICIVGPVTVFMSMSRMGMISLLCSATLTGILLAIRARSDKTSNLQGQTSLLITLAVAVLGTLLYFGYDRVYDRLATVNNFDATGGSRIRIIKDIFAEFPNFPLLGAGLGTHEFVFPMFSHLNLPLIATYAENEYVQLLEETGVVGVILAGCFVTIIIVNYFRATRRQDEPIQYAAFGLGFGLIAILIHSASDFGQHLPANAILTAISAALLVNLARLNSPALAGNHVPKFMARTPTSFWPVASRLASLACVASLITGAMVWADRARRAESLLTTAQTRASELESNSWQGSSEMYVELLKPATKAAQLEPTNISYNYYLDSYRWRAISYQSMMPTGGMKLSTGMISFASQIVSDLESIRPLCPTFGPPLCIAGQIRLYVLGDAAGEKEIRSAYQMTPYDKMVCLIWGALAVREKLWDDSVSAFSRYLTLGGSPQDFDDMYLHAGRPDLAYQLVLNNRTEIDYLATRMPRDPAWMAWVAQCQRHSAMLLAQEAARPDAPADTLAQLAASLQQQGRNAEAVELYNRALEANYGAVDWRFQLSKAMADLGRYSDASRELRVCLRLRPQMSEAQQLLADYSVRSKGEVTAGP